MITRVDPTAFRSFDRSFEELVNAAFRPPRARRVPFGFDAEWSDGSLVLTVDLPGTPPEAIGVSVANRILTVSVRRGEGETATTDERSLRLGAALDPEQVDARYEHGRLTVSVAPTTAPEARSVAIRVGASEELPAPIDTTSAEQPQG